MDMPPQCGYTAYQQEGQQVALGSRLTLPPVLNVRPANACARGARFYDIPASQAQYDFLIISPSFGAVNFGKGWRRNSAEVAPLGPLYVAAPLLDAGYRVRFLDLNVEHVSDAEFRRCVEGARIIGISFLTIQEENASRLIHAIREVRPKAYVIAGGHHCHLLEEPFEGADVTVTGEAEETIVPLIRAIESNEPLDEIPGLQFREAAGSRVIRTPRHHSQAPLERLPRPARQLVDSSRYGFLFGSQISRKIAGLMSSRGCVFHCSFCIRSPYPPYRERPATDVMDELEELHAQGYDTVVMADEYFLTNRKRVGELMDLLSRRGLNLRLIFQTRVNSVDPEIAARLKAGGVFAILFGIESGSEEVLRYYNKGATVERARKAIVATHDAGIFTYGGIILGSRVETARHFEETLAFVKSVPLDFVSFHHLVYMYGSPLWDEEHGKGNLRDREYWVEADSRFGGPSAGEIAIWRRAAFRQFYIRPRYLFHILRKCMRMRSAFPLRVAARLMLQSAQDGARVSWVHD